MLAEQIKKKVLRFFEDVKKGFGNLGSEDKWVVSALIFLGLFIGGIVGSLMILYWKLGLFLLLLFIGFVLIRIWVGWLGGEFDGSEKTK